MKNKMLRILSAVMVVMLLLGSLAVSAAPEGDKAPESKPTDNLPSQTEVPDWAEPYQIDEYVEIASNGNTTMFADMKNGKIALRNDKTGYIWYTVPNDRLSDMTTVGVRGDEIDSTLVVGSVSIEAEASASGIAYSYSWECASAGTIDIKKIDNGIRIEYDFQTVGFFIPVEYTLENGTLVAAIQLKEIVEGTKYVENKVKSGEWDQETADYFAPNYLMSVWLSPGFGAQNTSKNGYVFIPDGCGALVDFKPGFLAPNSLYDKPVYGTEMAQTIQSLETYTKDIYMPVFGTVVDDNAICGIIEVGDELSSILSIGAGNNCGYTAVSPRLNLRDLYKSYLYQGTNNEREVRRVSTNKVTYEEYRVRYTLLDGDNASYVGMADLYRDYLVEQKNLKKHETETAFNLDLLGCGEVDANFLGFTYKKKVAMTTFQQAETILKALNEAGIDNVATRLKGWTNNGLVNRKPSTKANPLSKLGGKTDFASLVEAGNKYGTLYPNQDMLNFTSSGSGVSARQDCVKTAFGMPAYQYKYINSVLVYDNSITPARLLAANALSNVSDRFKANYKQLGVKTLSLDTLTSYCFADFGKGGLGRDEMVKLIQTLLAEYAEEFELEGEDAYAYTLPYLTRVVNIPMDSSRYDFFDVDVPFYSMVVHGYMALGGGDMTRSYDPQLSLLKSVETGSELRYTGMFIDSAELKDTDFYEYFSTTYTLWLDKAAAQWKTYAPLQKQIQNAVIVNHAYLNEDVTATTYDNGVTVYVNYGDQAYAAADGTAVAARDFAYVGGEA